MEGERFATVGISHPTDPALRAATLPMSNDTLLLDAPVAPRQPLWLVVVLGVLALAAILVPLLVVRSTPPIAPVAARVVRAERVVPKAELPTVEPVILQAVAPTDARAFNATVAFSTGPNPAARPFGIFGGIEDQARAVDCLATAVLFEAGDDPTGEKAVAQVVLNRVRHPAFPKSVCGVVFQGSERVTGCQFSFTCDGSLARNYGAAQWERARTIARAALNGTVDGRVGHATHYHTDWVVPYWSSSLDKIVEVNTHLFFRWTGWWGTPPAFTRRYAGAEPVVPKLARLSGPHRSGLEEGVETLAAGLDPAALLGDVVVPKGLEQDSGSFLVTLDPKLTQDQFPAVAARVCGDRPYCKFMSWAKKAETPAMLPVSPQQQRTMAFSYLRDRAYGFEKALWNCNAYKGLPVNQCMKAQLSITMAPVPPANMQYDSSPGSVLRAIAGADQPAVPPSAVRTRPTGPDPLTGVRRKADVGPVPMMGNTTAPAAK